MKYKLLGRSGLRVSEISLGTMTFGEDWGWGASKDDSQAVFDAYVAQGGNFIDTANMYTNGSSEKIVGELIASDRDRFVLATKYTLNDRPGVPENAGNPNAGGNHRKNLRRSVEGSLKRLGTDYIDLLWLHIWDFTTPIEEIMSSLDDLVRAGKVNYIGISDTPAWIVSQANTLALLRGWTPFVALQVEYSLIERTPERDLIPMADAFGLTVTPWSPLGGGVLTGKYNNSTEQAGTRLGASGSFGDAQFATLLSDRNLAIARTTADIAAQIGKTPSQVALAWLIAQGPNVIPIIGTRKVHQLNDNLGSVDITLTADQLATLDAASKIDLGFPHNFLNSPMARSFVTAGNDEALIRR